MGDNGPQTAWNEIDLTTLIAAIRYEGRVTTCIIAVYAGRVASIRGLDTYSIISERKAVVALPPPTRGLPPKMGSD